MPLTLVIDELGDDLLALLLAQSQLFRAWERRVEVEGNLLDAWMLLHESQYVRQLLIILVVHYHVEGSIIQLPKLGTILQAHDAYPQHIHLDMQLLPSVILGGRNHGRDAVESFLLRQQKDVAQAVCSILPMQQMKPLDVEHAGTLGIAIVEIVLNVRKRLAVDALRLGARGAMSASAVAAVGNEHHTLQGFPPAQEPGSEEPPAQIHQLQQRLHERLPERDGEQQAQQGEVSRTLVIDHIQGIALAYAVQLHPRADVQDEIGQG